MINGNLACNGTASTNLNANNVIPVGATVVTTMAVTGKQK